MFMGSRANTSRKLWLVDIPLELMDIFFLTIFFSFSSKYTMIGKDWNAKSLQWCFSIFHYYRFRTGLLPYFGDIFIHIVKSQLVFSQQFHILLLLVFFLSSPSTVRYIMKEMVCAFCGCAGWHLNVWLIYSVWHVAHNQEH